MSPDNNPQEPQPGGEEYTRYGPRKRRKVSRSRSGCLTCRKRRKLCDQVKPTCGACERLSLDCAWPAEQLGGTPRSSGASVSTTPKPAINVAGSPANTTTNTTTGTGTVSDPNSPSASGSSSSAQRLDDLGTVAIQLGEQRRPLPGETPLPTQLPLSSLLAGPVVNTAPPPQPDVTLESILGFDEATLHQWAADCLALPTSQPQTNPFDALSALLPAPTFTPAPLPTSTLPTLPSPTVSITSDKEREDHRRLGEHYRASLTALVSCTPSDKSSAFEAFTTLASTSAATASGQGLHLATLAWAGRHMANRGEEQYEAISEKLATQAGGIVRARMAEWSLLGGEWWAETECLTLLAGLLMLMQVKICRGDVWGFDEINSWIRLVSKNLYGPDTPGVPDNSLPFSFFENLLYHDVLSTQILLGTPIIPYSVLSAYATPQQAAVHTLTGVALPLFCKLHRIASMIRRRRTKTKRGDEWTDEELVDVVRAAEDMDLELKDEKKRMDRCIKDSPGLAYHRYLHEAYRTACLLHLRTLVLLVPPADLTNRLLIRQSLSLLEAMSEGNLPGWCSAHWAIFATAVGCVGEERKRVQKLCDQHASLGFRNVARSRKIAEKVWERNDEGRIAVDWVDIIEEYAWELYFV